jgi:prophage antirepressor-like protein
MPTENNDTENAQPANLPVEFTFENHTVRTITKDDGEPWFVAADVCTVLDIKNTSDAVDRLDEDEKGIVSNETPGGMQDLLAVNEFGLYSLIFTSRKPEAKRFKRWITHEVLPAVRKTGRYEAPINSEQSTSAYDQTVTESRSPNGAGGMVLACALMTISANYFKFVHLGPDAEPLEITKRANIVPDESDKAISRLHQAVLHGDHLATQFLRRYE